QQQLKPVEVQMPSAPGLGALQVGRAGSAHWPLVVQAVVQTQIALGPAPPQHKHCKPPPHASPCAHGKGAPASEGGVELSAPLSTGAQAMLWHWTAQCEPSQLAVHPMTQGVE